MSELDIVRSLAKKILQIRTPAGNIDNSLWDRAQRLQRSIEHICRIPEISEAVFGVDQFCLTAAAYFSDAGLSQNSGGGDYRNKTRFSDLDDEDLLELSTQIVEEVLGAFINQARIRKISLIITECADHFTRMPEAMILSDARNLDDMGAVGIFNDFRQQIIDGKGVSDIVQNWKRKIDYQYWQARLKESFRFESVRKLAKQRLWAAERFMNQLNMENTVEDLEGLITESAEMKSVNTR